MADVIGPNRYNPGQRIFRKRENVVCDTHPDRVSFAEVVGETDSFGSETIDMCEECYKEYVKQKEAKAEELQRCEICGTLAKDVKPRRDPTETGGVYDMCRDCYTGLRNSIIDDGMDEW